MLTCATRLDVMNRVGRAFADPTRASILLRLLDAPGYPADLARELGLTAAIASLMRTVLAIDDGEPCVDDSCAVAGCCGARS